MMLSLLSDGQVKCRDIDTLKRLIRYKLGGYIVAINNIPRGHPFFRGVNWRDRPISVSQISYPPPTKVERFGRVNRPGVSMFYCSVAAAPVFFELRAKAGDYIALSEWETTESIWLHHVGYHQVALTRMGASDYPQRRRLTHPISRETNENARLRRLISLAFTQNVSLGEEYKYKQSVAIHELLFDGASPLPTLSDGPPSSQVAGTAYPSLQMKGDADNGALWPVFVDRSLKLRSVRYVLVEAADEVKQFYRLLTLATSREFPGGKIVWQPSDGPDIERRSHIEFENGAWTLRDGRGRVYNRH